MGKNKIGRFLSSATKNLPETPASKRFLIPVCPITSVAQLSGHKNLNSLDRHAVASQQRQRQMSKILSGKENAAKSIEEESKKADQ